ncbi:MAG TPA: DUF255 domain-containing protein [Candidatus Polarisedimenticolaceae bacterium]|nr:DUF255 domain-containing protein [Candidatus Polarisedimenticolaceae bacterium]
MIRFSPIPNRAHLVHWREWNDDPFDLARNQDKPVMLFLTAFWCRFCQRMDEEAFSDHENTALLNAYFISVRCDNAQRPDIDVRYNRNGWPTIAFMTADGDLLSVANYLPSEQFGDLLVRVYTAYHEKKDQLRLLHQNAQQRGADIQPCMMDPRPDLSAVANISQQLIELADWEYGGYGRGQKFIQPQLNDFLLARYEATKDRQYLDHVCRTLDRMRESPMRDQEAGGYFRTCSGRDWSRPHREKLLGEQAGVLANCVRAFRITELPVYARMAEELIAYLNANLFDTTTGAFYGCEDFLRKETNESSPAEEFFSILDGCIYTDANAQTVIAYLDAAVTLPEPRSPERALHALEFLWKHCRSRNGAMAHYFDGTAHLTGLLDDQVYMGNALLKAYWITGDTRHLEAATALAEFILARLKNSQGGYYDIEIPGPALAGFRLTLIGQNGRAASFFLALAEAAQNSRYREAALWALATFSGDFNRYGLDAACFGQALGEYAMGAQARPQD